MGLVIAACAIMVAVLGAVLVCFANGMSDNITVRYDPMPWLVVWSLVAVIAAITHFLPFFKW